MAVRLTVTTLMVLACRVLIILMAIINPPITTIVITEYPIILIAIIDNPITMVIVILDITDGKTGVTGGADMVITIMEVDGVGDITDDRYASL